MPDCLSFQMLADIVVHCLDPLFPLRLQNDNILGQSLLLTQNTFSHSLETKLSQLQPETVLDTSKLLRQESLLSWGIYLSGTQFLHIVSARLTSAIGIPMVFVLGGLLNVNMPIVLPRAHGSSYYTFLRWQYTLCFKDDY